MRNAADAGREAIRPMVQAKQDKWIEKCRLPTMQAVPDRLNLPSIRDLLVCWAYLNTRPPMGDCAALGPKCSSEHLDPSINSQSLECCSPFSPLDGEIKVLRQGEKS
jgi:hypothetical protein